MANKNIIFKGFVDDNELPLYYQNAKGFIFPQLEDFGITAVESQAAALPVIAYKKGGALDIVEDKTGVFFNKQTKESLIGAVRKFERMKFDKRILQKNAARFNVNKFKKRNYGLDK
jgi:glycosyltransferase involved in cell wall biosynthesis